ncbi:multidrug efflux system outer membrane protein [Undibacterium sp. GrIS 1.2]
MNTAKKMAITYFQTRLTICFNSSQIVKNTTVKNSFLLKRAAQLALMLAIAGCASIPPDQNLFPQKDIASAQLASDIKLASEGWPDKQWWMQYGDAQLNRLIAQALTNSPSLGTTAARIGSANAALKINSADLAPEINFNGQETRQRYSSNGLFPKPIGGSYYTETILQVQARYDFDWWGKHRAQIVAAVGEVNARRADYAQAELTLATAITQSYFNLQSQWALLASMQKSVAKQSDIVADKAKRVQHGLATADDQRMADAELSRMNGQIAQIEAQIGGEREALRALIGGDSTALADLKPQELHDISHALPAKLGMDLLARRPDLQASRWRVEASLSRVEASQAAFYPDINLTGSLGLDSLSLDDLLKFASRTLYIGPTISLPLFDSERIQAQLGASRSQRNEVIADYNQSVFIAVRDVAQQAINVRGIDSKLQQQQKIVQTNAEMLRSAQAKLKRGLAERGTVISAELALLRQQDDMLQLKNQQLQAEVSLIKALGGGYLADPVMLNTNFHQQAAQSH